jgi:hypothetical protein
MQPERVNVAIIADVQIDFIENSYFSVSINLKNDSALRIHKARVLSVFQP